MIPERIAQYPRRQRHFRRDHRPPAGCLRPGAGAVRSTRAGTRSPKSVLFTADERACGWRCCRHASLLNPLLLSGVLGARHLELCSEAMMAEVFPDCEVGAEPPFGGLYGVPVVLDLALAQVRPADRPRGCRTSRRCAIARRTTTCGWRARRSAPLGGAGPLVDDRARSAALTTPGVCDPRHEGLPFPPRLGRYSPGPMRPPRARRSPCLALAACGGVASAPHSLNARTVLTGAPEALELERHTPARTSSPRSPAPRSTEAGRPPAPRCSSRSLRTARRSPRPASIRVSTSSPAPMAASLSARSRRRRSLARAAQALARRPVGEGSRRAGRAQPARPVEPPPERQRDRRARARGAVRRRLG